MISVQNRPQRLSGNKNWLWSLALLLLLSASCDTLKQTPRDRPTTTTNQTDDRLDEIQGTRIYDPEKGEWVILEDPPEEKMDTVVWEEAPVNTTMPPITSEGVEETLPSTNAPSTLGGDKLSSYNLVYALPFLSSRVDYDADEIDNNVAAWSAQFYGGVRLALDDLDREGLKFNVSVLDTEASPTRTRNFISSNADVANAHMIIGPYRRDNIRLMADFAKSRDKVLVSPYSASSGLTEENPNFIQVSPTLETHCQALFNHAMESYRPEDVVLVCRDVSIEKQCMNFIQQAHFTRLGTSRADSLEQYVVSTASASFSDMELKSFLESRDQVVFIVPSWADETFVYSFLRTLDLAKDRYQRIAVYGMPQWMDFERIDYDYYERMHVRVSSPFYLEPRAEDVKSFKRDFYERYGALPDQSAFLGYDVTRYFGRMIHKYGLGFQEYIDSEAGQYLHTRFEFEKVVTPTTTGAENLPVDRLENKYLNILEFRDYEFKIMDR